MDSYVLHLCKSCACNLHGGELVPQDVVPELRAPDKDLLLYASAVIRLEGGLLGGFVAQDAILCDFVRLGKEFRGIPESILQSLGLPRLTPNFSAQHPDVLVFDSQELVEHGFDPRGLLLQLLWAD